MLSRRVEQKKLHRKLGDQRRLTVLSEARGTILFGKEAANRAAYFDLLVPPCGFLQLEAAHILRSLARWPPSCAQVPGGHIPALVPGPDGVPRNCANAVSPRLNTNSNAATVIVVNIFDPLRSSCFLTLGL